MNMTAPESTSLARSIVSDKPVTPPPAPHAKAKGDHGLNIHSISIKPVANGFTVDHMPKDPKHGGGQYGKESTSAFTSAREAHAHVGRLMGVTGAEGE